MGHHRPTYRKLSRMTRIASVLLKPISSAVLASLLTALIIAPETKTEIVERVYVRDPTKPKIVREVVVINRGGCQVDQGAILRAVNDVLNAKLGTGDGMTDNNHHGGGDISQSGTARSGAAVAGQVIVAIGACGSATVTADNHVEDVELETGDAEVDNDADIGQPRFTPYPRRTPRPRRTESPTPSPVPTLTPAPSI